MRRISGAARAGSEGGVAALKTPQQVEPYELYGKTITSVDCREKRPSRQAAARMSYYAEAFPSFVPDPARS